MLNLHLLDVCANNSKVSSESETKQLDSGENDDQLWEDNPKVSSESEVKQLDPNENDKQLWEDNPKVSSESEVKQLDPNENDKQQVQLTKETFNSQLLNVVTANLILEFTNKKSECFNIFLKKPFLLFRDLENKEYVEEKMKKLVYPNALSKKYPETEDNKRSKESGNSKKEESKNIHVDDDIKKSFQKRCDETISHSEKVLIGSLKSIITALLSKELLKGNEVQKAVLQLYSTRNCCEFCEPFMCDSFIEMFSEVEHQIESLQKYVLFSIPINDQSKENRKNLNVSKLFYCETRYSYFNYSFLNDILCYNDRLSETPYTYFISHPANESTTNQIYKYVEESLTKIDNKSPS